MRREDSTPAEYLAGLDGWQLAILVYIQTHLDADLSLVSLASRAGLSPSHFHRTFRAQTGETLKQYTQRLRLERAGLRLCLHETTVLETALEVGFQSHETFTRAFRRRFGVLPREVLSGGVEVLKTATPGRGAETVEPRTDYALSASTLVRVKPMHLAFIRHIGPYEEVGDSIFVELRRWADREGVQGPSVFLGIGLDAPGITPPDKLRYDAALRVEGPIDGGGAVGYQRFPGGSYVVATHVGHYSTLTETYGRLVQRIGRMKGVRFAGLPTIEMYHETTINVDRSLNHTDIYLPVVLASTEARASWRACAARVASLPATANQRPRP